MAPKVILSIGNFDGVHRGHQNLIQKLKSIQAQTSDPTRLCILTFEPHPIEILRPGIEVERLTPPDEKARLLKSFGIDEVIIQNFDLDLAAMSPEDFFRKILVNKIQATQIVVGENFKFGQAQAGDVDVLKKLGSQYGVFIHSCPKVLEGPDVVSSSRIRKALAQGDLKVAEKLLGRPHKVFGSVVHGEKRGSTIGVPTANLRPTSSSKKSAVPKSGVYVTKTYIEESSVGLPSVTNIGVRPTVTDGRSPLSIETHVLSPVGDLYGKTMSVEFLDRIRDEKRFGSLEELKQQIQKDIDFSKGYLH